MYRILAVVTLIFCVTHSTQSWADIQVQGYLNSAALENLASDPSCVVPANCPDGRIYWNTTVGEPRMYDGTTWQEIPIGSSTVPDPLLLGDGTAANPTYSFTNQTGTGTYRAANILGFSVNGDLKGSYGSSVFRLYQRLYLQVDGTEAAPGYTFNNSGDDDGMWLDSGVLRFSSGARTTLSLSDRRVFIGDPSDGPTVSSAAAPGIAWAGDTDSGVYNDGTNIGISKDGVSYFATNTANLRTSIRKTASSGAAVTGCFFTAGAGLSGFDECASSIRFKENIRETTDEQIALLSSLRPVTFDWKETGKRDYGFIAEEVAEVIPELVNSSVENGVLQHNGVKYRHMVALLLAKIQKMEKRIEVLEAE